MGRALFLVASIRKISFIWASFSGSCAAKSLAWDQSSSRLYSSQVSLSGVRVRMLGFEALGPGKMRTDGRGYPAVVVDRTAAHDLKVPGKQLPLGLRIIKCVGHADPIDRVLGHAIDLTRWGDVENLVDRGDDIVTVMELGPRRGIGLDLRRPAHRHRVACTAEVGGQQFDAMVGCAARPSPAAMVHVIGQGRAKHVQPAESIECIHVLCYRGWDAVVSQQFADGATSPLPRRA